MQLSNVIGKPVLTPTGEERGYVVAANLSRDYAKISCLVCADAEEEEFYLPARAILSVGDAVIAAGRRLSAPNGVPSPVGKEAYTIAGILLGTISDVRLGEDAEPVFLLASSRALTQIPARCVALGERAVVYPEGMTVPAAKKPPKKSPQTKKEAPMSENKVQKTKIIPEKRIPVPRSAELLNGTNLLGRRVKKSVFDERGAAVAVAGERITPAVLSRARRSNRLVQLAVNTLTNV